MITNTLQHRSNYSVDMSVHSDRFIVMSDPTALGPDRGIGHLPSAKVVIIIENQNRPTPLSPKPQVNYCICLLKTITLRT